MASLPRHPHGWQGYPSRDRTTYVDAALAAPTTSTVPRCAGCHDPPSRRHFSGPASTQEEPAPFSTAAERVGLAHQTTSTVGCLQQAELGTAPNQSSWPGTRVATPESGAQAWGLRGRTLHAETHRWACPSTAGRRAAQAAGEWSGCRPQQVRHDKQDQQLRPRPRSSTRGGLCRSGRCVADATVRAASDDPAC